MKNIKEILEKTQSEIQLSEVVTLEFAKKLKFTESLFEKAGKRIKSLKKDHAKKFTKSQESFESKLQKLYESGKKATGLDTEIESLNREISFLRKKKLTYSNFRGLDIKTMREKINQCEKERDKLRIDFDKNKQEVKLLLQDFNKTKEEVLLEFNSISCKIGNELLLGCTPLSPSLEEFLQILKGPNSPLVSAAKPLSSIPDSGSTVVTSHVQFESQNLPDPEVVVFMEHFDVLQVYISLTIVASCDPRFPNTPNCWT